MEVVCPSCQYTLAECKPTLPDRATLRESFLYVAASRVRSAVPMRRDCAGVTGAILFGIFMHIRCT